jgi:hypothetical protein
MSMHVWRRERGPRIYFWVSREKTHTLVAVFSEKVREEFPPVI